MRHFTSGIDWAMAGAATAVDAARPTPADFRNSRRFILRFPLISRLSADATGAMLKSSFLLGPVTDERLAAILRNNWPKPIKKEPGAVPPRASFFITALSRSGPRTGADHEGVVGVFGDLPPQIFVVPEGEHVVVHLLE